MRQVDATGNVSLTAVVPLHNSSGGFEGVLAIEVRRRELRGKLRGAGP